MRRYGEPVVRGQAYRDRPGAYGVIVEGDAMLLVGELNPKIGHLDVQMPGGGSGASPSISAIATCPITTCGRARSRISFCVGLSVARARRTL